MAFVQDTARRLLRNHSARAHLPRRFAGRPIYLSAANQLSVLKLGEGRFDRSLFELVDRFVAPDSVAWDIGVNMGVFAVPAATRARFVLGFEPDPFNQRLLQRSKEANPDLPLEVLPVAVADRVGIARLNVASRGRASNSLDASQFGQNRGEIMQSFSVVTVTLDWALDHFPAPHFIKCDAESAEVMILQGATRMLAEIRPVIVIEMPEENAAEGRAIFDASGYACFSASGPINPAAPLENLSAAWNVLAIPAERAAEFVDI